MLKDISEKLKGKPKEKVELDVDDDGNLVIPDEIRESLIEWAKLDREYRDLKEARKEVADPLVEFFEEAGIKSVDLGDEFGEVKLKTRRSRRASKKSIVEEFGDEGREFWDAIPPNVGHYLKRESKS